MFGNPEWFRERKIGWGVVPVSWRGWGYVAAWIAVMAVPFMALLSRELLAESLVWLAASMGTLLLDVHQILKAKRQAERAENVLYIGEEETDAERLSTRNYDLSLRR